MCEMEILLGLLLDLLLGGDLGESLVADMGLDMVLDMVLGMGPADIPRTDRLVLVTNRQLLARRLTGTHHRLPEAKHRSSIGKTGILLRPGNAGLDLQPLGLGRRFLHWIWTIPC